MKIFGLSSRPLSRGPSANTSRQVRRDLAASCFRPSLLNRTVGKLERLSEEKYLAYLSLFRMIRADLRLSFVLTILLPSGDELDWMEVAVLSQPSHLVLIISNYVDTKARVLDLRPLPDLYKQLLQKP